MTPHHDDVTWHELKIESVIITTEDPAILEEEGGVSQELSGGAVVSTLGIVP